MADFGVYSITCIFNGYVYYGRAVNVYSRLKTHQKQLEDRRHHCKAMQADFIERGKSFQFSVVRLTPNYAEACQLEKQIVEDRHQKGLPCYNSRKRIGETHPYTDLVNIHIKIPMNIKENLAADAKRRSISINGLISNILYERYKEQG